ncbi:hypothetical protein A1D22_04090 [Pasteurellaceae bacterium LFhippo2]|nr:hypothetical protein [Pasteurellaceae bacterium LFhippo2]
MKSFVENFIEKPKNTQTGQIGISENKQLRYIAFPIHNDYLPKMKWQNVSEPLVKDQYSQIVISTNYQYIWRKIVFVPLNYNQQMCYRQVIMTIEQNIPLSLNELFFDFHITAVETLQRISIFALRKQYVEPYLSYYPNSIIDCELHCFARGINYLNQQNSIECPSAFYKFKDIYFQFKYDELLIQQQKPPSDILSVQRFNLDSQIPDPELYICALGASLWNGKV